MRALVLGSGLVGLQLADELRASGWTVVATTTSPAKLTRLRAHCDEARVLRGSDAGAVRDAVAGCDAVAVCAGPDARRAMTAEDRAASYADVLVETACSVVAAVTETACGGPVVALSSLSVYGDGSGPVVDEDSPTTASTDASPRCFLQMERTYLHGLPGQACLLRCADIYGGDDPPLETKVAMAHRMLAGSVPFSAAALFYRVHVLDVVAAIRHAIQTRLTGIVNLTHAELPPTNAGCFDAIAAGLGLAPLSYRGELRGPTVPVSTAKLTASGFTLQHTRAQPRHVPAGS